MAGFNDNPSDRAFVLFFGSPSKDDCIYVCNILNYAYAGMTASNECWCHYDANYARYGEDTTGGCTLLCSDGSACGNGSNKISVYRTYKPESLADVVSFSGVSWSGCYEELLYSGVTFQFGLSVHGCVAYCRYAYTSFTVASLSGTQCLCGYPFSGLTVKGSCTAGCLEDSISGFPKSTSFNFQENSPNTNGCGDLGTPQGYDYYVGL